MGQNYQMFGGCKNIIATLAIILSVIAIGATLWFFVVLCDIEPTSRACAPIEEGTPEELSDLEKWYILKQAGMIP